MSGTLAHAIRVLEERASVDEAVAEAVVFLAGDPDGPADPFARPPSGALAAARAVNERRQVRARIEAAGRALDTADVVALIGSINDRKGVDRRRRRGQLLGWRVGTRTLHPSWQFDGRRGDTWTGLPRVLAALAEVAPDPREADSLMTAGRDDLDGRALSDLLADGRVDTVVQLIRGAGDQA